MAILPDDTLSDAAVAPAEAEQDGTRVKQQPLKDLIAADKYAREQTKTGLGIGYRRAVPPGALG